VKKLIIGLLVVAALAGIVFASLRAQGHDKGETIYAAVVERRELAQVVKATGELQPRIQVNISAHVVGKIDKLYVQEGDRIGKGKPFLHLEEQAFLALRDQWAAQLRSSQTAVQQAKVSLADAQIKLARAQKLKTEGILTQTDLETAQLAETSARLALDSANENVGQSNANLVKAQDDLTKTTIYSPIDGRVIALNAKEGEVVITGTMNNPGSVIGIIADMADINAEVDVDETEIVNIRIGQQAVLRVDALPGKEYKGKVIEVGSSGYNRTNQPDITFFKVKVLLDHPDDSLRARMSVRAEISTAAHPNTLTVPIQAVVEREDEGNTKGAGKDGQASKSHKVVFVITGGKTAGKAHMRTVETGLSDETNVELTAGIKAGEQVVTGPYRTLRDLKDGAAVQVSQSTEDEDHKADDPKGQGKKE
jgi:HlyD family secretion protein